MANDDEIYLIDMWRIVTHEWRWFVGVAALVLLVTFAWLHTARSQWEATAWIQVGQVGAAPSGQDPKIEAFSRALERLDTRTFRDEVLRRVGVPLDAPEAVLYRRSMKVEPMPYANLMKVRLRAYSAEDAKQLASATADTLHGLHARIGAVPMALARERMVELDRDLGEAQADRERLSHEAKGNGAEAALAGVALASRNEDIRALEQIRSDLANRLLPNYTFETSMPWPVSVPDDRVFPNTALTAGLGGLAALFLASLAAVARHALRSRPRRAAAMLHAA
ncbi:chain-length determining protein [Luteibacter flocculans]|uniref:Chain-length determining protein n=1 Tax=Luteibacter flocculans TaxID=2780091 RepID=A0ABY4T095_9GAMM|nr:Wzz/FepE/Etk N-terminal domain-containing protein [Luteibacter flocculans]URL57980.1 chain-length determining protein [Luteibacter flocculans]